MQEGSPQSSPQLTSPTTMTMTVTDPRTHLNGQKPLYTDYQITIRVNYTLMEGECTLLFTFAQTNDIAFHREESSVRRRYSEFVWLKDRLAIAGRDVPALPPKAVFGRFEPLLIESRRVGLEKFVRKLLSKTVFLSDRAVQLFVQTTLSTDDIELIVSGKAAYLEEESTGEEEELAVSFVPRED
eukprot:m.3137 g.3137  ORF g.3137 m.3137 type:complete len:184 (+) comp9069_c0_seq2:941-1492(+)